MLTISTADFVQGLEASYGSYRQHHEGIVHFRDVDLAPYPYIGLYDLEPREATQGHRLPHDGEGCCDHCLQI